MHAELRRNLGVLEGSMGPQRCEFFCTKPTAENGQPTVKCGDYRIFQAPKCTRATFFLDLRPDPTGRAYSIPPDTLRWWGGGLPENAAPYPRTLRRPRYQTFGPRFTELPS